MLIVKIMSGENIPDADPRKSHRLFTGIYGAQFGRDEEPTAHLYFGPEEVESFACPGNVYVMNEAGKTISTFSPNPIGGPTTVFVDGRPVGFEEGPIDCERLYSGLGQDPKRSDLYHQNADGSRGEYIPSEGRACVIDGGRYVTLDKPGPA